MEGQSYENLEVAGTILEWLPFTHTHTHNHLLSITKDLSQEDPSNMVDQATVMDLLL